MLKFAQRISQLKHTGCINKRTLSAVASDLLDVTGSLLSEDNRLTIENTRRYMDKFRPMAQRMFRTENTEPARDIIRDFGEAGLLGVNLPAKYGCAETDYLTYGLIAKEVEAVDSGFRSMMSVQSSLVMLPIWKFGQSEAFKLKYLPRLASGELVGAFGLTEPNHGSDPAGMETTARELADGTFLLNGSKNWITNSPIADVFIIWAKHTGTGEINGFLVDRAESNGQGKITTPYIPGKFSLRASPTGMIFLDNVQVPAENRLQVTGLKGPFTCLNSARYGISWGVLGAADDCLRQTIDYLLTRRQFGKPLAANQIVQNKLSQVSSQLSTGLVASWTVGRWLDTPNSKPHTHPERISLVKRNNCQVALDTARVCRDLLGGNGISDEYNVIRHMLNLEAVNTYEGTHDIHGLIIGRAVTGIPAF